MTTATTATVMIAREVQQQLKFRACLHTAVLHKARSKVKDHIRAEGGKVSHYSARDLSAMAEEYVRHHREELIEACRPWVHELVFKSKR